MINPKIELNFNFGFKWFGDGSIKVKGWILDENRTSIQGSSLVEYFQTVDSADKLRDLLNHTGGHFAVIITTPECVIAAVDRGRSIPLYYRTDGGIEISDSGFSLMHTGMESEGLDEFACQEYLAAGHVTGNNTLIKSIHQLGAGEIATITSLGAQIATYFEYLPHSSQTDSFKTLSQKFVELLETDYRVIISALNGRTVVIPLSGGYDSRSIAAMFKRLGYPNVICYSFGKAENPEKSTSKAVAETLGYPWLFVETTPESVKDFAQSEEFLRYVDFAANAGSFYIIQDFFAVKTLHVSNLIPADAVFMPGHSGDTLGGSNFLELLSGNENKKEMIEKIIKNRYDLNSSPSIFTQQVRERLSQQYGMYENPALWFDYWCMKEWNPKMFANGVRVYDYFGYSYLLPLWGKNLLSFFANLPLKFRLNKELYEFTLETEIFEPLGINFTPERRKNYSHTVSLWQHSKNIIKRVLPKSFKYNHFTFDPINSKLYCSELVSNGRKRGFNVSVNGTNSIKAQWYIKFLQQRFKGNNQPL